MYVRFLLVDSDAKLAVAESAAWASRGMEMERAECMTEGIQRVTKNDYLFVGINDDNIDFMPLLSTMRGVTDVPILIATSRFSTEAEVDALENGADLFARWHKSPEANMASVMAHISRVANRGKTWKHKPRLLTCGNLLVMTEYKMVFCNDREIELAAKEYGLLVYLMAHRNITLSLRQIALEVWGYEEVPEKAVWKTVERLRKRLSESGFYKGRITLYRGLGYRFATRLDA